MKYRIVGLTWNCGEDAIADVVQYLGLSRSEATNGTVILYSEEPDWLLRAREDRVLSIQGKTNLRVRYPGGFNILRPLEYIVRYPNGHVGMLTEKQLENNYRLVKEGE